MSKPRYNGLLRMEPERLRQVLCRRNILSGWWHWSHNRDGAIIDWPLVSHTTALPHVAASHPAVR